MFSIADNFSMAGMNCSSSHHKTSFFWRCLTSACASNSEPHTSRSVLTLVVKYVWMSFFFISKDHTSLSSLKFSQNNLAIKKSESLFHWFCTLFSVCRCARWHIGVVASRVPTTTGTAALLPTQDVSASSGPPELLLHGRANHCWSCYLFDSDCAS